MYVLSEVYAYSFYHTPMFDCNGATICNFDKRKSSRQVHADAYYNFPVQVINYSEDTVVRLQLWDIAGQERFGNMTRVYYRYQQPRQSSSAHLQIFFRDAAAAFVVFDLTRRATFEAVRRWKEDLDSKVVTSDGAKVGHDVIGVSVDSRCILFDIPHAPDPHDPAGQQERPDGGSVRVG